MKKLKELLNKKWVISIFVVIIVTFIAYLIFVIKYDRLLGDYDIKTRTKLGFCTSSSITKYYTHDDVTIYLSCLSSVKIKDENKMKELKDYLSEKPDEFEKRMRKVLSHLDPISGCYDCGMTYGDLSGTKMSNSNIEIVECNTLAGNNDFYIGPKGNDLSEHCKKNSK